MDQKISLDNFIKRIFLQSQIRQYEEFNFAEAPKATEEQGVINLSFSSLVRDKEGVQQGFNDYNGTIIHNNKEIRIDLRTSKKADNGRKKIQGENILFFKEKIFPLKVNNVDYIFDILEIITYYYTNNGIKKLPKQIYARVGTAKSDFYENGGLEDNFNWNIITSELLKEYEEGIISIKDMTYMHLVMEKRKGLAKRKR